MGFQTLSTLLRTPSWTSHAMHSNTSTPRPPADTTPILVMDMYEHAYQMDYGAAAARYIDAFFANVQWDVVSRRLEQA
jgi:superoxide dismutase